jgi:hypothetical protein
MESKSNNWISTGKTFKWIKCVESIFNEVGLGYIFQNQVGYFDKNMDKQILSDQFIQKWH